MAKELLRMADDADVPPQVKLAAIRDALSRAGITERSTVEVDASLTLRPFEEILTGIAPLSRDESRAQRGLPASPADAHAFAELAAIRDRDVIDAEVVPETYTRRKYFDVSSRRQPERSESRIPPGYPSEEEAMERAHRANVAAGVYPQQRSVAMRAYR